MFRFQGFVIGLRFQGPGFYFVGVLDFGAASCALELRGLCNVALCFGIFMGQATSPQTLVVGVAIEALRPL